MTDVVKRSIISLVLLYALAVNAALAAGNGNQFVHQEGLEIVDGKGVKLKLKSVNLPAYLNFEGYLLGGGLLVPQSQVVERLGMLIGKEQSQRLITDLRKAFVTREDIEQIASRGFNCVRVPVNYRLIAAADSPGWAQLDQLAQWCADAKIYMVIDLHAAPGGQSHLPTADPEVPILWQSKPKGEETVKIWHEIAQHFKNNATVAGYDLLNEPQPDGSDHLLDLYKRIIKSIRSVDPDHMVIIEGMQLSSEFSIFPRPLDSNMVYSFHMYTWFGDDRAKKLAVYGWIAHKQNVPFWVGEFGENNYQMIESTLKMFSEADYLCGWSYWCWKRAPGKYPNLNIVEVPAGWKDVMAWIGNPFHKRPKQQEAVDSMEQFIKAVSIQNAVSDKKLAELIMQN